MVGMAKQFRKPGLSRSKEMQQLIDAFKGFQSGVPSKKGHSTKKSSKFLGASVTHPQIQHSHSGLAH